MSEPDALFSGNLKDGLKRRKKEVFELKESKESFQAVDAVAINYLRFEPAGGSEKVPGVLFEPGNRCTADDYRWIAEAIAKEGYVVYDIYQRGYGSGTPGVNDRGGLIQQGDFREALRILKQDPRVDPERIAVGGHSNGSHISLRTAAQFPVNCCFAMSQVCDWSIFVKGAEGYYPDYYKEIVAEYGGTPEENPGPYQERSNLYLAGRITCPVLNLVGGDDTVCPPHLSRMMHEALLASGNTASELRIIEGVGHFFERYAFDGYKLEETAAAVCDFLRRNL